MKSLAPIEIEHKKIATSKRISVIPPSFEASLKKVPSKLSDKADEATGLSPRDKAALREMLLAERTRVLGKLDLRVHSAIEEDTQLPDEMDAASRDQEQAFLLRLADKERKLLSEIDHALSKFEDGTYGLCEGTDEPIGLKRLQVRPWARYSIQYKEQMERNERDYV